MRTLTEVNDVEASALFEVMLYGPRQDSRTDLELAESLRKVAMLLDSLILSHNRSSGAEVIKSGQHLLLLGSLVEAFARLQN